MRLPHVVADQRRDAAERRVERPQLVALREPLVLVERRILDEVELSMDVDDGTRVHVGGAVVAVFVEADDRCRPGRG